MAMAIESTDLRRVELHHRARRMGDAAVVGGDAVAAVVARDLARTLVGAVGVRAGKVGAIAHTVQRHTNDPRLAGACMLHVQCHGRDPTAPIAKRLAADCRAIHVCWK